MDFYLCFHGDESAYNTVSQFSRNFSEYWKITSLSAHWKKLERYIKFLVSSYHGDEFAYNTVLQFSENFAEYWKITNLSVHWKKALERYIKFLVSNFHGDE